MLKVEVIKRSPNGVFGSGEVKAGDTAARFEHAIHLRKSARSIGHISDSVCHSDGIESLAFVLDILCVDDIEIDIDSIAAAIFVVLFGNIKHLRHKIGALNVPRPARSSHAK